jgi:hypothetical protein
VATVGFVSLGPSLPSVPTTSTVNLTRGATTANGVTVALNASGQLQAVYNGTSSSATCDVIFDVTGYFTADTSGLSFYPVVPVRLLDSSTGKGLTGPFAMGVVKTLAVAGTGGISVDALGIAGNLTLVNPTTVGYAYVAPSITGTPKSSTVNAVVGRAIANGFDVLLSGSGSVDLILIGTTSADKANMQLDVTGYWK